MKFSTILIAALITYVQGFSIARAQMLDPSRVGSIPEFFNALAAPYYIAIIALIVFVSVLVGLDFIFARGNPAKIENARRHLGYFLIGTTILLSVATVVRVMVSIADSLSA